MGTVPPRFRLALTLLGLAVAGPARAQSALGQLEDICRNSPGANCNPSIPEPPAPTRVDEDARQAAQTAQVVKKVVKPQLTTAQLVKVQVTGMLLQGLISSVFDSGTSDEQARIAAEQQARLEAQLLAQRTAAVQQQRAARDAEGLRSMEDLSAALTDPWVGNAHTPPPAVDLTGKRGVIEPFAAPVRPGSAPAGPDRVALASERLARLAAENGDVAVLADRLAELEGRLAGLRGETVALKREMKGAARELDAWGAEVDAAVKDARDRGLAMAFDGLLSLDAKALARLGEVQSNSRAWNRMTGMLRDTDAGARAIIDASDTFEERAGDARWLLGRRELGEDVKFLAMKLGGRYAEAGQSILTSAQSIRTELQAWRGIDAERARIATAPARLATLKAEYAGLVADVKAARAAVSAATGIDARDLIPPPPPPPSPGALGSPVPHPDD
ncbi:MAG: hypothetical protein QM704_09550 [Anaeromyxobacteraceae bacterium]